jgi:hypothetical protein
VNFGENIGRVTSIWPNMASPVLKEFLVIKINDHFTGTLDKDDIEVRFE